MRDWIRTLPRASFRGQPFYVEQEDLQNAGRRVAEHEYAKSEDHSTEDMGRNTRRFRFDAYVVGDQADSDAQALIELCSIPGDGELVLQVLGRYTVKCTEASASSANPIRTAVLLLLFTDARAAAGDLTFEKRGDRRGWPGDGFDVDAAAGEAPLGSRLWLFRRSVLNDRTLGLVEAEARRALQPLVDQQLVVRIDVTGSVRPADNTLALAISLYGRDGTAVYAARFDPLWKRADGL